MIPTMLKSDNRLLFSASHRYIQRLEEAPVSVDQKVVTRKDGKIELTATVEDTLQLH